jgi:hypothetical protein
VSGGRESMLCVSNMKPQVGLLLLKPKEGGRPVVASSRRSHWVTLKLSVLPRGKATRAHGRLAIVYPLWRTTRVAWAPSAIIRYVVPWPS